MIIFENLNEEDMLNKEYLDDLLEEASKTMIPPQTHTMLLKKSVRENMLKKFGKEAFLDSENLKYPVKNPKTGQYDCRLIYTARLKALQSKKIDIAKKAKQLYDNQNCQTLLNITIKEHTENVYDLCELLELFLTSTGEYK